MRTLTMSLTGLFVATLLACSGSSGSGVAGSAGSTGSAAQSPTPPPQPAATEGRMDGKFNVGYKLVKSNVSGSSKGSKNTWHVTASCETGGSCSITVESLNNDWTETAAFGEGHYRWTRKIDKAYTCGGPSTAMGATYSYDIVGNDVKLIDGEWVVSSFEGSFTAVGDKKCGTTGLPTEKYAVTGTLIS